MRRKPREKWDVLVAPKLMKRQEELGLSYEDLMDLTGIDNIAVLMEVIASDNWEVESVYPVGVQKKIYDALQVNMLDVFEIECAFCRGDEGPWTELAALPRNQLIMKRREQLGLSFWDLLTRLGYASWFKSSKLDHSVQSSMKKMGSLEDTPDAVDDLVFMEVVNLAAVLGMPLQLLLGVKCSKCEQ